MNADDGCKVFGAWHSAALWPGSGITGQGSQQQAWRAESYLVDLVPAVLILAAHGGMLVEKQLAAVRVAPHNGRVIQRCEPVAVLVIWGGAKLQEGLGEEFKVVTTGLIHGMN